MLELVTEATETVSKLAYSINEISAMTSLSKSYLRNEIRAKNLVAKKIGTRVVVLRTSLISYLESKKDWEPENKHN